MSNAISTLVQDYGWIHTSIGLVGNALFVAGSVLFLPRFEQMQAFATWLFIFGSTLMLVGALGGAAVKMYERTEERRARAGG